MNKKYILALFLFLLIIISTYYISVKKIANPVEIKAVFSSANLKSNCKIENIKEETDKYRINVYYPVTNYEILNAKIKSEIDKRVSEFKKQMEELKDLDLAGQRFLEINFDSYECDNYISYAFHSTVDLAGAHPNTYIWTINYDTVNKKIITIDDLIKKNKDILNIFSKISYDTLKNNTAIKEYYIEEMLINGTKPIKENFERFVFDKQGILLFFEKYSVGPYVAGEFCVCVPYDKIK